MVGWVVFLFYIVGEFGEFCYFWGYKGKRKGMKEYLFEVWGKWVESWMGGEGGGGNGVELWGGIGEGGRRAW